MTKQEKNDHMWLWDEVEQTNPDYTKDAAIGNYKFTNIIPQYMIMRATEIFGPVGIGWGWDFIKEEIIEGGPVIDKHKNIVLVNGEPFLTKSHMAVIQIWYNHNGERHIAPESVGTTTLISKYGGFDEEAPKKSRTDALKKGLSYLGFSADIYLGEFEDQEYQQLLHEQAEFVASDKIDKIKEELSDSKRDFMETTLTAMNEVPTQAALDRLFNSAYRKMESTKNSLTSSQEEKTKADKAIQILTNTYNKKTALLTKAREDKKNGSKQTGSTKRGRKAADGGEDQESQPDRPSK